MRAIGMSRVEQGITLAASPRSGHKHVRQSVALQFIVFSEQIKVAIRAGSEYFYT